MTTTPTRPFTAGGPGTPATVWRCRLDPRAVDALTLDGVRRVVVAGAHPDDESLGAGGLVAAARAARIPVTLVCATDGEGSHPDSPTHDPASLAVRRAAEWDEAARELGVDALSRHRLRLDDGDLERDVDRLTQTLVSIIGDGTGTVLAGPWREDGHPDHTAVGGAAAAAARRTDADLWEYPIWFWHWASPEDRHVRQLRSLDISAHDAHKQRAIRAHQSQVAPLSPLDGDEALLSADVLAHFSGPHEWYVVTPGADCRDDAIDELHRTSEDPWGTDSRWYERRKRELLLAMLPRPGFRVALEVGCSTGALTEALLERADHVVAVDRSPAALALAGHRLAGRDGVTLADLDVPAAWPEGKRFDLVVVSEVGYFLSPAAADALVERVAASLSPDGVVALCHWRHPVEGWLLDAAEVHRRFEAGPVPPLQAECRDRDVEIRVHADTWPDHDR